MAPLQDDAQAKSAASAGPLESSADVPSSSLREQGEQPLLPAAASSDEAEPDEQSDREAGQSETSAIAL